MQIHAGLLEIEFQDDPSFVRSETVLIDLMRRSIGIIFQNAYHELGLWPADIEGKDMQSMTRARLMGHGEGGREILLHAPIRLVS